MDFCSPNENSSETLVEPAGLPTRTEIDEVHGPSRSSSGEFEPWKKRCHNDMDQTVGAEARRAPRGNEAQGADTMMPMSMPSDHELIREVTDFNTKVAERDRAAEHIKDDQVEIATTPKDRDRAPTRYSLYRYRPLTEQRVALRC